jgi:error-prone DNA polymerase
MLEAIERGSRVAGGSERVARGFSPESPGEQRWFCNVCAHDWDEPASSSAAHAPAVPGSGCVESAAGGEEQMIRFRSIDHLIAHAGLRRDELVTLAQIGALNGFGYDRRSALWQVERAVRPAGEMFEERTNHVPPLAAPAAAPCAAEAESDGARSLVPLWDLERGDGQDTPGEDRPADPGPAAGSGQPDVSPLRPMTNVERVIADYDGTGLTIGPHPMALRPEELALRGILRAIDLPHARRGRRVRVAGAVITRQRPGTAKGFVFLTLEDETGISNVIVQPDVFTEQRIAIVREPFVIVEGILQQEDGVTSVRAERVLPLAGLHPPIDSHDFH